MQVQFLLFYLIFGSWCAWLIVCAASWLHAKKTSEKTENIRPRKSDSHDAGGKSNGSGNKSNGFSGYMEFAIVTLIAIASMLGIMGVAWFQTAG